MEVGKNKFLKVNVLCSLVDCVFALFCALSLVMYLYLSTFVLVLLLNCSILVLVLLSLPGPACLRVSPDQSQFFRYDSISLNCSDQANATGWKVKRRTPGGGVRPCTSGWGSTSSGSTCTIRKAYPSDSGEYWCQSADGEKSNGVNITITGTVNRQDL